MHFANQIWRSRPRRRITTAAKFVTMAMPSKNQLLHAADGDHEKWLEA
jgi:hypothetical protein